MNPFREFEVSTFSEKSFHRIPVDLRPGFKTLAVVQDETRVRRRRVFPLNVSISGTIMGNVNLEIRLNVCYSTPDNTNLVRIDVENASDERRLPYTRLAPFVSAVRTGDSTRVLTLPTRTMRNLRSIYQSQTIIYHCRLRAHLGHSASVSST
jgi:hypothetical protein